MINNSRLVENAFNMLKFLYDELGNRRFETIDISICKDLDDLYALIISLWCMSLAKEGLYKEYVTVEGEELTSPKGQVNLSESITRQTILNGKLVCDYDELSDDIYINQVLKGTLLFLANDNSLSESIVKIAKKALQSFNGVSYTEINNIRWKNVVFNNNNSRYKHLIEICQSYYGEKDIENKIGLDDGTRVYILFKKQLLKYLKETYSEEQNVVIPFEQPYTLEDEPPFEIRLNKQQKMVAIENGDRAVLYLIRLQDDLAKNDSKMQRKRMYELLRYVREYESFRRVKTTGVIVYTNIDRRRINMNPMSINSVDNHMLGEVIVDLFDQWRYIVTKLNEPYKAFIERYNKRKR